MLECAFCHAQLTEGTLHLRQCSLVLLRHLFKQPWLVTVSVIRNALEPEGGGGMRDLSGKGLLRKGQVEPELVVVGSDVERLEQGLSHWARI